MYFFFVYNLKIYKFLINFNYVSSFDIFMINQIRKKLLLLLFYFICYFGKAKLNIKRTLCPLNYRTIIKKNQLNKYKKKKIL